MYIAHTPWEHPCINPNPYTRVLASVYLTYPNPYTFDLQTCTFTYNYYYVYALILLS